MTEELVQDGELWYEDYTHIDKDSAKTLWITDSDEEGFHLRVISNNQPDGVDSGDAYPPGYILRIWTREHFSTIAERAIERGWGSGKSQWRKV